VEHLSELLDDFQGKLTRVRCFAHVLNLVVKVENLFVSLSIILTVIVQAILSQFSKSNKATPDFNEDNDNDAVFCALQEEDDDEEVDLDVYDDDGAVEASDNAMVDEIVRDVDQELFGERLSQEDINLGCFSLSKVCSSTFFNFLFVMWCQLQLTNLRKKIFNSPTLRADLKACCERVKIKPVLMIRAVSTRWNTTAELIGRAKDLRLALNLLINKEQHNKSCGVRLKQFQLSTQEWDLLLQLHPLLDVSCHQVIPYHYLMSSLT
jgi:hypothetical protein